MFSNSCETYEGFSNVWDMMCVDFPCQTNIDIHILLSHDGLTHICYQTIGGHANLRVKNRIYNRPEAPIKSRIGDAQQVYNG